MMFAGSGSGGVAGVPSGAVPADGSNPAYRIHAGAPASPVVLHVPHSSRHIPPLARQRIALDDAALSSELDHMTDAHTDLIAAGAAAASTPRPWTLVNLCSRLVVDPERFPDDREEMRAVGMGAVYTRTRDGRRLRDDDPAHTEHLLAAYFRPYAAAIADLVDERLADTGRAVIIDVHSYPGVALPYELHGDGQRPAICLGTDPYHTTPELVCAAEMAFAQCGIVALNTPFAGCYVPARHHRRRPTVTSLMVEIRRDGYMTEPGRAPTVGVHRVVRALSRLIDVVSTPIPRAR
jgi:N-formylglutamate amidohydrolase